MSANKRGKYISREEITNDRIHLFLFNFVRKKGILIAFPLYLNKEGINRFCKVITLFYPLLIINWQTPIQASARVNHSERPPS